VSSAILSFDDSQYILLQKRVDFYADIRGWTDIES
jgi:hypothetical protein